MDCLTRSCWGDRHPAFELNHGKPMPVLLRDHESTLGPIKEESLAWLKGLSHIHQPIEIKTGPFIGVFSAPIRTRFASSLGDQQDASTIGPPSRVLAKSYFAIGLLQRWPPWNNAPTSSYASQIGERHFALFWIGPLPYQEE